MVTSAFYSARKPGGRTGLSYSREIAKPVRGTMLNLSLIGDVVTGL
jgi:hypothetical protein